MSVYEHTHSSQPPPLPPPPPVCLQLISFSLSITLFHLLPYPSLLFSTSSSSLYSPPPGLSLSPWFPFFPIPFLIILYLFLTLFSTLLSSLSLSLLSLSLSSPHNNTVQTSESSPKVKSMKKKRMDHSWDGGRFVKASGYTMKAKPYPGIGETERINLCISMVRKIILEQHKRMSIQQRVIQ